MGYRLIDNKDKVVAALKEQVANGLNNAASFFVTEAQKNAAVDTGFMRDSTGVTVAATPNSLFAELRALAPYSGFQDVGQHGNLWFTRAFLVTKEKFKQFIYTRSSGTAGPGVIKAALTEYHGVTGRKGRGF
jgi:hypothetical protein